MRRTLCENLVVMDGFRDHDYLQTVYTLIPEIRLQPRDRLRSARFPHLRRVLFPGDGEAQGHILHTGNTEPVCDDIR